MQLSTVKNFIFYFIFSSHLKNKKNKIKQQRFSFVTFTHVKMPFLKSVPSALKCKIVGICVLISYLVGDNNERPPEDALGAVCYFKTP